MGVANLYSIEPLKRICADLITRSVCVQNVAVVLHAADTYQVVPLRQHCITFMVEHFAEARSRRPPPLPTILPHRSESPSHRTRSTILCVSCCPSRQCPS